MAWTRPGTTSIQTVGPAHLAYFAPRADDPAGDGLPAAWKLAHGLDPILRHGPHGAYGDFDNDGLSNLEEYQLGTHPGFWDTDGDGLPDAIAWVLQHGLHTGPSWLYEDYDGDGLTNLEEYLLGIDPHLWDSSGDGISDYQAVHVFHIDPSTPLFTGNRIVHETLTGDKAALLSGSWTIGAGGSLQATSLNGVLEYTFTIPEEGVYVLAFLIEQAAPLSIPQSVRLSLRANGIPAGSQNQSAPHGQPAEALFVTPRLPAGSHTFRLEWENTSPHHQLTVHNVRLLTLESVDADENGIPDWLEQRAARAVQSEPPPGSPVSPVCFEGESPYRASLHLYSSAADDPEAPHSIHSGPALHWFANIPLHPDGTPTTVDILDDFTGAAKTHTVTWTVTNLFDLPPEPFLLRSGDSLRLTALPEGETGGTFTLSHGDFTHQGPTDEAIPFEFEGPGDHLLSYSWTDGVQTVNGQATVRAVASSFNGSPILITGRIRVWDNPSLAPEAVLDHHHRLHLTETPLTSGRRLTLRVDDTHEQHLLARLGKGGPVLAHATLQPVRVEIKHYFDVVANYPDGSRLVEVSLVLSHIPPDLLLNLRVITGGVTFENGALSLTITAADFDEHGRLTYRLIQPPGVSGTTCHRLTFVDQGTGQNIGQY